jgi:hypothetical protein
VRIQVAVKRLADTNLTLQLIHAFFCTFSVSTATDEHILQTLMELVCQLVNDGELMLARTMRKEVLEKYEQHQQRLQDSQHVTLLSSYQLSTK